MKTLYSILLSVLFSLTSVSSIGQAEMVTEDNLGNFRKFHFVNQNKALLETHTPNLQLYDFNSSEITHVIPGLSYDEFILNGEHFVLCQDTALFTIQFNEEGYSVNTLLGEYGGQVLLPQTDMPQNRVGISTSNGLLITNGTSEVLEEIDLDSTCLGWSSIGNNLMVYSASSYYVLDESYSIIESGGIPEGYQVLKDAGLSDRLILAEGSSEDTDYLIYSYDVLQDFLEPILNSEGDIIQITEVERNFTQKRYGDQLILTWSEYWDESIQRNWPHRIATIDMPTLLGYVHPLDNSVLQEYLPEYSAKASFGTVAFGRYSKAGYEPYLVTNDSLQLLKDIYDGYGPSIEVRKYFGQYSYPKNEFSFTEKGGHIYFIANHPKLGRELWRTDGTSAGTVPILDLEPGPKGLDKVRLISSLDSDDHIYFEAWGMNEYLGIFKVSTLTEAIEIEETPNQWESTFGLNNAGPGSSFSPGFVQPDLYPAKDGSVAFLNAPNALRTDWIGYNTYKHANYFDSTWAWGGVVHVLEEDGSARFIESLSFKESSSTPTMARDYETGDMLISIPHRYQFSRYGNTHYHQGQDGNHLIYLNSDGSVGWDKFIDANVKIKRMEFLEDDILLYGEYWGYFPLDELMINAEDYSLGFVANLNSSGEAKWLRHVQNDPGPTLIENLYLPGRSLLQFVL